MKTTCLFAAAFGILTAASPMLDKRYMVTETVIETATVTVTAQRSWGGWHGSSASDLQPIPVTPPATTPIPSSAELPTSSAPAVPTQSSALSQYAAPILEQHNLHRANHSANDLIWDDGLAMIAQQIAQSCVYAHDVKTGGGGYGQNIGAGAPPEEVNAMITNQMYNDEIELYPGYGGEPNMNDFERWGHFSQIVWVNTTSVGCYTQHCTDGLANTGPNVSPYFTVCNYKPAGNYGGQYATNVLQPIGKAMMTIKT